jgi:hypothetical protein
MCNGVRNHEGKDISRCEGNKKMNKDECLKKGFK